ncbi:MAG: hypothetical protein ACTHMC_09300 [Pseudobacter sp.]|uniref:hypothetical protein n=1 Tax=Pseudobacter sp. TaxID=2045420 RepID=UPI003F821916
MFILQDADVLIIKNAISMGGEIWENPLLAPVKRKIKNHYRGILNENCCYCRRDTTDEFNMVLDIEHVLPKVIYGDYMFEPFNLSVSCKRCNMEIKKDKILFLINPDISTELAADTNNYKFIHPNLDLYKEHLTKEMYQYDDQKLIKYNVVNKSPKGEFTKVFFELEKIEQDSFNSAQGITPSHGITPLMAENVASELRTLLNNYLKG